MKIKYLYIFSLVLLFSFSSKKESLATVDVKLLTTQKNFEAGRNITLEFSTSENKKPLLYCYTSYGSTLISPRIENLKLYYKIPKNISNRTGKVGWKLINDASSICGQFNIKPLESAVATETYIGPPSIEAGGRDFSMLVVIPTDSLDNPLAENTPVNIKHQFLDNEYNNKIFTKNLLTYKSIYSPNKNGRILVSSECLNLNSKEFTITVYPSIPTNFNITAKRPHGYADGNQITSFKTSVIKDKNDNIVVDGTYVDFFITNSKENVLKTSGTTINGVATAKIIHPDYKTKWQIKAYINGMAESDVIKLVYKEVLKDFEVKFSENNREITVGPLKSFMNQMIPDGLQVSLSIYKKDVLITTYTKSTNNGFVNFKLNPDILNNDSYKMIMTTAGIEKAFENKTLW